MGAGPPMPAHTAPQSTICDAPLHLSVTARMLPWQELENDLMAFTFARMRIASLLTVALAAFVASPAMAEQDQGYVLKNVGTSGECQLVMSTATGKPVTLWDRKKGLVFGLAVAQPGKCPKTTPWAKGELTIYAYPSYNVSNRVLTVYSAKGDRRVIYRAYGDRYVSRWIAAPKPKS